MDTDNYTQPLESVMREERKPRSLSTLAASEFRLNTSSRSSVTKAARSSIL